LVELFLHPEIQGMDDLLRDFLTESAENLARLDAEIVELERTPEDHDLLKSIFRTIHTIKGTCGFLDLARLERVAHAAENVLGLLRDGELGVQPEIISDVLAAVDTIKEILQGLEKTGAEPSGDDAPLIARLDHWVGGSPAFPGRAESFPFPVSVFAPATPDGTGIGAAGGVTPQGGNGVAPEVVPAAASGQAANSSASGEAEGGERGESRGGIADASLRIGVGILDLLMNLAGELVLTRNQLLQLAQDDEDSAFRLPLQHLNRVTSELQEAVTKTRMQPIGNAWQKLPRLVRDLCQSSGKQVRLEMFGADTELDRQILQAVCDPLTHMVRNSADHGIERPEERRAAGKPEYGTVVLEAFHEGGHIVIEIRDDGKGLDADAIRRRAVERGLVRQEAVASLTDSQVFRFVFEPGFSTAEKVTSVSGRGVGMDVVRSNIEGIGGTVELISAVGRGTTVRVKIPLTLAILSALIVGTGALSFAVPQIGVVELVGLGDGNRSLVEVVNGSSFFRFRDSLLPLIRLGDVFNLPKSGSDACIVVCHVGDYRFGLVVDEIYDTQEIVVKPLGRMVKGVRYYSGTTILGDGRVIMILDVPGISALTLGGVSPEEASDQLTVEVQKEEGVEEDTMSVVVFSSGTSTRQAVPLALVSRLEKIPTERIESADGRWMVQYRGSLLPLVPASEHIDMRADGGQPVIVFSDGTRSMGLAVQEITDILDDRLDIQTHSVAPGVIGAAVIAGRSTEIIDIDHYLRLADPAWFRFKGFDDRRQRILLVDDSRFFLNVVAPVLRSSRFEVVTSGDGDEALERLESGERFDLIITDIDMPRVDGWELSERLRAHPAWRDVPLLALTGRGTDGDRERAYHLGFRDFLQKFDRESVLEAVHAALGRPEEAPV
jgi:two-component system, chemotaxis family, sensor kinase CheA